MSNTVQQTSVKDVLHRTVEIPEFPATAELQIVGFEVKLNIVKSTQTDYPNLSEILTNQRQDLLREDSSVPLEFLDEEVETTQIEKPVNSIKTVLWHYLRTKSEVNSLKQNVQSVLFDRNSTKIKDTDGIVYIPYNIQRSTVLARPIFSPVYSVTLGSSDSTLTCINRATAYEHFEFIPTQITGKIKQRENGFVFTNESTIGTSTEIPLEMYDNDSYFTLDELQDLTNPDSLINQYNPRFRVRSGEFQLKLSHNDYLHTFSFKLTKLGQLPKYATDRFTIPENGDYDEIMAFARPAKPEDSDKFISRDGKMTLVDLHC